MKAYIVKMPELWVFLNKEKALDHIVGYIQNNLIQSFNPSKYEILDMIEKNDYENAIVLYNSAYAEQIEIQMCEIIQ